MFSQKHTPDDPSAPVIVNPEVFAKKFRKLPPVHWRKRGTHSPRGRRMCWDCLHGQHCQQARCSCICRRDSTEELQLQLERLRIQARESFFGV